MKRKILQCTKDGQPLHLYDSIREAEKKYHITHISTVCLGKRRTDGGYIWYYVEDALRNHVGDRQPLN